MRENESILIDFCYLFSAISASSAVNRFWLRLGRAVLSAVKKFKEDKA
jgi:hypothetical protein